VNASANQAFYQVAVALIPGLLFGGALLEARDTREAGDAPGLLRFGVVLLVVLAGVAEIVSIRGAVGGSTGTLGQRVVVFVVVVGTVAIGVRTAMPWLGGSFGTAG
jgi:hypothetical protein